MITQKKIAEMAGVSRATVDRVLNNRGEVNESTKNKIEEIIHSLDYKPNRAGKALVIQQKHISIGCIIIDAKNPFYAEIKKGIENKISEYAEYGISVIIKMAKMDDTDQIRIIDELVKQDINALVIQPVNSKLLAKKLQEVADAGVQIVTTNTDIDGFNSFCYVGNCFQACGETAANLLALLMHNKTNVGIVTGFMNAKSHADRIDGFRKYVKNYKDIKIVEIVENHDDEFESYHLTYDMLKEHKEIDSVFIVAGGVYGAGRAIQEFQKERSICAISFDDVDTTRELIRNDVIQATICQQSIKQGELSLEVLLNYFIKNEIPKNRTIYTEIQIKIKSNIDM